MTIEIAGEALAGKQAFFERAPEVARQAAQLAMNQVATRQGLALFQAEIALQVNFPAGYVTPDSQRLFVSKKASQADLEIRIAARSRPTSLARFATGPIQVKGEPRISGQVSVNVKPGGGAAMPGAFLVRLRAGNAGIDEKSNIGLAIRLKPGQTIHSKRSQSTVQLGHNLVLLYGPSVNQILLDVADKVEPDFMADLDQEFTRQYVRLAGL